MKIAVAVDHRGIVLRDRVFAELNALRCDVIDLGTDSDRQRVDYPDKAQELGAAIYSGTADRGILVCSTGVGAAIAACKLPGIRASICHDPYSARQGVEHDALNVLCLGSEIVGGELAAELVRMYVEARFRGSEPAREAPEEARGTRSARVVARTPPDPGGLWWTERGGHESLGTSGSVQTFRQTALGAEAMDPISRT